jgi:VIT1/CCC1 family predicted Fe2+/Mn2+ transporter
MVLTFTLGAKLLGPEELVAGRELLVAAIGCNIAWGIIDGFLFLLGRVFERRRLASLRAQLAALGDREAGLDQLRRELSNDLADIGDVNERDRFYASIVAAAKHPVPMKVRITGEDLRGAVLVFFLVVLTAIPAAIPFLIIDDPYVALRVSNAVLALLLFVTGYWWGRHIGASPLLAGGLIMSIGVVLVLIAIPLGG